MLKVWLLWQELSQAYHTLTKSMHDELPPNWRKWEKTDWVKKMTKIHWNHIMYIILDTIHKNVIIIIIIILYTALESCHKLNDINSVNHENVFLLCNSLWTLETVSLHSTPLLHNWVMPAVCWNKVTSSANLTISSCFVDKGNTLKSASVSFTIGIDRSLQALILLI